jgi:sulfur relay protein TusB/DsrH
MTTLHLIFSEHGARNCLARSSPDDLFLLLQDGVYSREISRASVLREHASARGLQGRVEEQRLVDWSDVVRMTEIASPVMSWP